MKKRSMATLGILMAVFLLTTTGAVGTAPSSYNSDAKALLEMLWAKLDESIVGNYNVAMLLRYHDHTGTDPGDFTTKGKPIGTNGIQDNAINSAKIASSAVGSSEIASGAITSINLAAGSVSGGPAGAVTDFSISANDMADDSIYTQNILNGQVGADDIGSGQIFSNHIYDGTVGATDIATGAITATKLSTAARTRSVTQYIGDIDASTDIGQPIFISSGNATITALRFSTNNNVVENDTNYKRVAIYKYNVSGGGFSAVKTIETTITGGMSVQFNGNYEAINATSGLSSTDLVPGQIVTVNTYNYGAGVTFNKFVLSMDYTVSE